MNGHDMGSFHELVAGGQLGFDEPPGLSREDRAVFYEDQAQRLDLLAEFTADRSAAEAARKMAGQAREIARRIWAGEP